MEVGFGTRERLNALDGWQRLGLVLGPLLSLTIVLHSLIDGRHPYVKNASDGVVPWYGIAWETSTFDCGSNSFADLIPSCKPVISSDHPKRPANIFDQFDVPSAPAAKAVVEIVTQFYDLRVVLILALTGLAAPSLLIAITRWIGAGFRRRNPL